MTCHFLPLHKGLKYFFKVFGALWIFDRHVPVVKAGILRGSCKSQGVNIIRLPVCTRTMSLGGIFLLSGNPAINLSVSLVLLL